MGDVWGLVFHEFLLGMVLLVIARISSLDIYSARDWFLRQWPIMVVALSLIASGYTVWSFSAHAPCTVVGCSKEDIS